MDQMELNPFVARQRSKEPMLLKSRRAANAGKLLVEELHCRRLVDWSGRHKLRGALDAGGHFARLEDAPFEDWCKENAEVPRRLDVEAVNRSLHRLSEVMAALAEVPSAGL